MTARTSAVRATAAVVLALAAPWPAFGHGDIPHLAMLDARARADAVLVEVLLEPRLFDAWAGRDRADPFTIASDELAFVRAKAGELVASVLVLAVDDTPVALTLGAVAMIEIPHSPGMVTYLRIEARASLARAPRRLGAAWGRWDALLDGSPLEVPASLSGPGGDAVGTLTRAEPELVWHATEAPVPFPRPPPGEPAAIDPARAWSVVAALLLALAPVSLAIAHVARAGPRARRVAACVPLAAAATCGAVAAFHVFGPSRAAPATLPPDEALATAETLVRRIYGAFDETRDEAIYDALGTAVEGRLLERVYADVHGALVLREAGGATCRVAAVEVGARTLDRPERPIAGGYGTTVAWVVRARVAHWGHVHTRDLAYRARIAIRHTPAGWRIAAIETLEAGLAPPPR